MGAGRRRKRLISRSVADARPERPSPTAAWMRSTIVASGSPGSKEIFFVKIGASRSRRCLAEGEPDAAPLVEPAAGDEAVQARELGQCEADRTQHEVKERDRPLWR